MAYDEGLAERVRTLMSDQDGLTEKKMFGGVGWMLDRNMAVGILGDDLMVRCALDATETLLAEPGATAFEQRGRAMRGWLIVSGETVAEDDVLATWCERGSAFAASLPPKV